MSGTLMLLFIPLVPDRWARCAATFLLGRFTRPASGPQGQLQAQPGRRPLLPTGVAERSAARDADPNGVLLGSGLRLVHQLPPVPRAVHRPRAQADGRLLIPLWTVSQTAPQPLLRPLHQAGAQRVTLDIAAERQEVGVVLHREGLETALIKVPLAGAMAACLTIYCRKNRASRMLECPKAQQEAPSCAVLPGMAGTWRTWFKSRPSVLREAKTR